MIVFSYWYALLPCLFCLPAQAHRLDEYLQAATIGLASDGVSIQVRLSAGQAVAQSVWAQMDADRDGQLSAAEQRAYALRMLAGLTLTIDGRPQPLSLQNWSFPMRADIDKGMGEVSLHLHAPLHVTAGRHHLHFEASNAARTRPSTTCIFH